MTIHRRQFLVNAATTSAGLFASCALPTSRAAQTDSAARLPIIDTHQHLWDLRRFRLPWLDGAPEVLKRDYLMSDYQAATAGLNVVKSVYMEVDVSPDQQLAEADYLLEICRSATAPTVGAVISGRPNSLEFHSYIRRFRDVRPIKGVRQVLHSPSTKPGLCLEPQFVASIRLLGDLGKSFDLCLRPAELTDALRLVVQCPATRFILDHCGNADPKAFLSETARGSEPIGHSVADWKRDIAELARRDNVICKISGIVARVPSTNWTPEMLAPVINHCLDAFGPSRVVFGGDWPVCLLGASYRRWVDALLAVITNRPEPEQRQLLHDNAVRSYALDGPS